MAYLDRQRKARYYYNARYAIVRKGDNMANITNRNGKFLIRVFTGRDISGKQIVKSTTYVPPEGTSPKRLRSWLRSMLLSLKGTARVMPS